MGKYWLTVKNSIQNNLVYRFNIWIGIFGEAINLSVLIYLWRAIYSQGNTIGAYSLGSIISYFVISRILNVMILYTDWARLVGDDILEGRLVNYLLKPISYLGRTFFANIGQVIVRVIVLLPVAVPVLYFLRHNLDLSLVRFMYFMVSVLIGISLHFFFFYMVGMSAFYFDNISGIGFLAWLLSSLMSGRTVPIDILPQNIQHIANLLPFKYTLYLPVSILNGHIANSTIPRELLFGCAWVTIMYLASRLMYKIGIKRYESFGL